jgi:hypothetical protein
VNGKINKQFKYINTPFITDSLILNEIQYKVTEGRYKLQTILLSKSKIINKDNVNSLNLNIKINQYTSYEVKLYVNNILVATLTKTKVIGRNIVSFDENSIRTNGMYGTSDTFTRNQITSDYTINLIDIKKSDNIKVEYLTYSNSFDNKGSFDLNIDTVEKIAI